MDTQTYAPTPEEIPSLFVQAWNARDANGIANLFTLDANFVNVVGIWWKNRKDIWKAHDYGLRVIFKDSTLEVRQVNVKYLTPEVATVHSRMKLVGQSQHINSKQPGQRFNIFTFVVQKQNSGWVVVAAHNTDQAPFKETNLIDETGNLHAVSYRNKPSLDK